MNKHTSENPHLPWGRNTRTGVDPLIGPQYAAIGNSVLCLRNNAPKESAVMSRLYCVGILATAIQIIYITIQCLLLGELAMAAMFSCGLLFPAMIGAFMLRHIRIIRRSSDYYFNRITKRVYWRDGKQLYVGDWSGVQAGPRSVAEGTGGGVTVSFYLEMIFPWVNARQGGYAGDCRLRLEGNDVSDPRPELTAQVWEYVRHFMEQGPTNLPRPADEAWWWYQPPHKVYLNPREAVLRYLPWRTGMPGEHEGKKWWTLPIWAVMFPYNMLLMLCWWATCKVLKVQAAEPPPEAFEGVCEENTRRLPRSRRQVETSHSQ